MQTTTDPALELLEVAFDAPPAPPPAAPAPPRSHWRVVAAIAVAVAVALVMVSWSPTTAEEPPLPQAGLIPPTPDGIAGFAEMFLSTYLTAGAEDAVERLAAFYPAAPEPTEHGVDRFLRHVATLAATPAGDGAWELRLAADVLVHDGVGYRADGIHHYLVGVLDTPQGFTATSLPVRIPAPAPAPIAATGTGIAVDDPGLLALIDGFLAAYLTGAGDVRSFTTADASIVAVAPPPFRTVRIDSLTAVGQAPTQLRVVATGTDGTAELRLEYHLRVAHIGGALAIEHLGSTP